ncbi:hypothetical protein JOE62_001194 [Glutamicibacter nicotianae]|nr:hypothetical protein [Glutamicibacter nicotianae]
MDTSEGPTDTHPEPSDERRDRQERQAHTLAVYDQS